MEGRADGLACPLEGIFPRSRRRRGADVHAHHAGGKLCKGDAAGGTALARPIMPGGRLAACISSSSGLPSFRLTPCKRSRTLILPACGLAIGPSGPPAQVFPCGHFYFRKFVGVISWLPVDVLFHGELHAVMLALDVQRGIETVDSPNVRVLVPVLVGFRQDGMLHQ